MQRRPDGIARRTTTSRSSATSRTGVQRSSPTPQVAPDADGRDRAMTRSAHRCSHPVGCSRHPSSHRPSSAHRCSHRPSSQPSVFSPSVFLTVRLLTVGLQHHPSSHHRSSARPCSHRRSSVPTRPPTTGAQTRSLIAILGQRRDGQRAHVFADIWNNTGFLLHPRQRPATWTYEPRGGLQPQRQRERRHLRCSRRPRAARRFSPPLRPRQTCRR